MSPKPKVGPLEGFDGALVEDRKARELFRLVARFLKSLGGVERINHRTQVSFRHGRSFAWIWLPQMWIRHQSRGSITLTFGLDHKVRDRRIKQSVEPYPGRYTHHVVLSDSAEFDARVQDWLREAHRLAAGMPSATKHRGEP